MQGLEITEIFDEPLALAPTTITGEYMPSKPQRNHDPRIDIRGTMAYPLTEQVRENIETHGEEWTRRFYLERGITKFEMDVLVAGAKAAA